MDHVGRLRDHRARDLSRGRRSSPVGESLVLSRLHLASRVLRRCMQKQVPRTPSLRYGRLGMTNEREAWSSTTLSLSTPFCFFTAKGHAGAGGVSDETSLLIENIAIGEADGAALLDNASLGA